MHVRPWFALFCSVLGLATSRTAMRAELAEAKVATPKVWLDYDQAGLDAAYDQTVYAKNFEEVLARYTRHSAAVREGLGEPLDFPYGTSPIEVLHVYRTAANHAPVQVFLHGGAWRSGLARDYAFPAELFTRAGAHFVVVDFAAVQDVGGDLGVVAQQVRRAVAWVYAHAGEFGGDRERLFLSGFSSGAHLAAVLLTTSWAKEFQLPGNVIKGGLCCSGIYDLVSASLSSRRHYVAFTPAIVEALSPLRHLERVNAPLLVAYGTNESPEFKRQATEFAAALQVAREDAVLLVGPGFNHFEIIETLASPTGLLGQAVLQQMGLSAGK